MRIILYADKVQHTKAFISNGNEAHLRQNLLIIVKFNLLIHILLLLKIS